MFHIAGPMKRMRRAISFSFWAFAVTDALILQTQHEGDKQDVYVTFVSGSEYWKYAFVLTSALRDLGHTHQHVYMVKEGSAEAHIAPEIERLAAQFGLNIKIQ